MENRLSSEDRKLLLALARESIELAVHQKPLPRLDLAAYSPDLKAPGAAFVTLTQEGELRGCIGTLEAYQPLVEDVREHAIDAALHDYRFQPVTPQEVRSLQIEISRLTPPEPFDYSTPDELISKICVGVDGVILKDGMRRATFLPQVWETLPDPAVFLSHLCQKMGAAPSLWRQKKLDVMVYQVEEFHE
jgi:AmmeMemoRadiSam system protein A